MANRLAVYKNKYYIDCFEHWWATTQTQNPITFSTSDELYVHYTLHQLQAQNYKGIIGYDDFMRLAYKLGVTKLGADLPYGRAPTWRPSDDTVMRWTPNKESSQNLRMELDVYAV